MNKSILLSFFLSLTFSSANETTLQYDSPYDGYQYAGPLDSEGKPHGKGKISGGKTPTHSFELECHFTHGVCNGFATLKTESIEYTGEFKQNLKHGYGQFRNHTGIFYEGNWQEGNKHGYGHEVQSSGLEYLGEWSQGEKHGLGTLLYPDGSRFIGVFVKDRPRGVGGLSSPDKSTLRFGQFENQKLHGVGIESLEEGKTVQAGIFEDGFPHSMRVKAERHRTIIMNPDSPASLMATQEASGIYLGQQLDGLRDGYGISIPNQGNPQIQRFKEDMPIEKVLEIKRED